MVEPRWKDWKDTWIDYADLEWGPDDQFLLARTLGVEDGLLKRFDYEQQTKGPDGKMWPVYRVTFEDGTFEAYSFKSGSKGPLKAIPPVADVDKAAIASHAVMENIWDHKEERLHEYRNGERNEGAR